MEMIRVQNTKRNQLHIGTFKHDGEDFTLVMGSTSDKLCADPEVPKPERVIPQSVWDQAVKLKPVRAWLDDGTLRTFPV